MPLELRVQASLSPKDTIQLFPEVADVLLEQAPGSASRSPGALLLQQGPLGVQDLVLLLQESDLQEDQMVICELTSPPGRSGGPGGAGLPQILVQRLTVLP